MYNSGSSREHSNPFLNPLMNIERLFLPAFVFGLILCFGGCETPSTENVDPASTPVGKPYFEQRREFQTKLTHRGPSPQDWEDDGPLNNDIREIRYPSGDLQLKAWVYVPDVAESRPRPAIVFCHGGFASGPDSIYHVEPFIGADYVVMAPTWRGENGNPGSFELMFGEVDDAANAVRWLAEQSYVDSSRIYMFGHSIGGGISAMASLMDDIPLRHSGSSGGLYDTTTFEAWCDIAPFSYRDAKECRMRILIPNIASMQREHYAYIGRLDRGFLQDAIRLQSQNTPRLRVELIDGDHFTSFEEAVERYFKLVEADK